MCSLCREALAGLPPNAQWSFFLAVLVLVLAPYFVALFIALGVSKDLRVRTVRWLRARVPFRARRP